MVRRFTIVAAALLLGGLLAGTVLAATINGNAKNNVLRGTNRADTIRGNGGNDLIYGNGGNDKLYGGPGNDSIYGGKGNDLIVGGPGADFVSCGPGRDTVQADANDSVSKDCEVVRGGGSQGGSGGTTTTTAPPPPPPPTYVAKDGTYTGNTSQNEKISFQVVSGGSQLINVSLNGLNESCTPYGTAWYTGWGLNGAVSINPDGSFAVNGTGDGSGDGYTYHDVWSFGGQFSSSGTATGTIKSNLTFHFDNGSVFDCTAPNVTWSVLRS
jgi:hypothetical protein